MRAGILLCTLILVFSSCAKQPSPDSETAPVATQPIALLVDREISGTILHLPLRAPFGLAVDKQGAVYLVDSGNDRVILFNDKLEPVRDVGGHGNAPGLFDQPGFITLDNELNLYVADVGNRRVCRHNRRLEFVDQILLESDDDPFLLSRPTGLAVTNFGELWMCDEENNRIALFDNVGQFDRFVGDYGYAGGQLQAPQKIVRLHSRQFVVCDYNNGRLAYYDEYGNFDRALKPNPPLFPSAIARDSDNRIWSLDRDAGTIACIDSRGRSLIPPVEQLPGTDRAMQSPSDLIILNDGRLLISDTGNNRLLLCKIIQEES